MSFELKNSQLSNETLGVINQLIELDINATSAFKLARIIKFMSSITEDKIKIEKKIYEKWVSRDDEGNPVIPTDDEGNPIKGSVSISDVDKFTEDMQELMDTVNNIPFDKLNFSELGLKTAKIKDIIKIEFLFLHD